MTHLRRCVVVLIWCVFFGCSRPMAQPAELRGSSQTLTVLGEYTPVALDRVDGLALENGKLVLRGGSGSVTLDLPASADPGRPNRHWALVTEGVATGKRVVTFTHDMSLDEFTIELPASDAELHYGALTSRTGGDVLVFAWGAASRSSWGYVAIARR
jgi:hypothetical protein